MEGPCYFYTKNSCDFQNMVDYERYMKIFIANMRDI